jgi:alkylhydroperoxidase family enzyme
LQGPEHEATAQALRDGDLENLPVTPAEQELLRFVEQLTLEPHKVNDASVDRLRAAGWSEAQMAETVYIASFFNMMVRIADAFGAMPPSVADVCGIPRAVVDR